MEGCLLIISQWYATVLYTMNAWRSFETNLTIIVFLYVKRYSLMIIKNNIYKVSRVSMSYVPMLKN